MLTTVNFEPDLLKALRYLALSRSMSLKEILHLAAKDYLNKAKTNNRNAAKNILKEMKAMSRWGKQKINLTTAVIQQRERLANI